MENVAVTIFLKKALGARKYNSIPADHKRILQRTVFQAIAARDQGSGAIERFEKQRIDKLSPAKKRAG